MDYDIEEELIEKARSADEGSPGAEEYMEIMERFEEISKQVESADTVQDYTIRLSNST